MASDPVAERAVLAGICQHGSDVYLDVADFVKVNTFMVESNQVIFKCLTYILKEDPQAKIDLPSILGAAKHLGLDNILGKPNEMSHLSAIMQMKVDPKNVRRFGSKIRKLEVARLIESQAGDLQGKMRQVDGTESISQIIGMAEEIIFDLSSLMDEEDVLPKKLGADIIEYLEYLCDNPVTQMGISSGFKLYDKAIGGGLRPGTVNVIGARPKTGKTVLSDNMGYHISANEGLPVLNMDTEMLKEDHQHRTMAMLTRIPINKIETGQFGAEVKDKQFVMKAAEKFKEVPYFHKSIAGMPFEDQLAIMRRWIHKEVGLKPDGTANPCVIIYDYLKLMEGSGVSEAMKEYQLLGFMMTTLHNFAVRYKIPLVVFMQLNRDGIDGEDTSAAAGSDRIVWLCSNFSIYKKKSDEEMAADETAGNRKLIVVASRHGEGHSFGNYINCYMEGWCARIIEGEERKALEEKQKSKEQPDDSPSFRVKTYDTDEGQEEIDFNRADEPPPDEDDE